MDQGNTKISSSHVGLDPEVGLIVIQMIIREGKNDSIIREHLQHRMTKHPLLPDTLAECDKIIDDMTELRMFWVGTITIGITRNMIWLDSPFPHPRT